MVSSGFPWQRLIKRATVALGVIGSLLSFCPGPIYGTVFDWPGSGWTAGTPGPGQTVTQMFTSVTPNDITVSVNNNGAAASGATWQASYPQISANPLTNGFSGVNSLQLYVISQSSTSSFIRTTVSFSSPVTNLSFQIWDVDAVAGQFADKISSIQAIAAGGATIGPDSVASAVPGYNTITGSGISTVVLGIANADNATNQGAINIVFNGPITQFSFNWTNNDPGLGAQAIALGSLTYTIVPETNMSVGAALICVIAMTARSFQKRRRAKFQAPLTQNR